MFLLARACAAVSSSGARAWHGSLNRLQLTLAIQHKMHLLPRLNIKPLSVHTFNIGISTYNTDWTTQLCQIRSFHVTWKQTYKTQLGPLSFGYGSRSSSYSIERARLVRRWKGRAKWAVRSWSTPSRLHDFRNFALLIKPWQHSLFTNKPHPYQNSIIGLKELNNKDGESCNQASPSHIV